MTHHYQITPEVSYFTPQSFDDALVYLHTKKASDITIQSGSQIIAEINGLLHRVTKRSITHQEVIDLVNHIYGANGSAQIQSGIDIDSSYQLTVRNHSYRFRVNMTACEYNGYYAIQITLRAISAVPPSIESMNLPDDLYNSLKIPQGIVIVSGATGSGKSTLLASILADFLKDENSHLKIVSYEAPIEYTYDSITMPTSMISQSEIPKHLPSFHQGVRNALRRKPGLIMVGEARDKETLEAVIEAALTGHPVYTTLHSNDVIDTFRRAVNLFPAAERHSKLFDLIETVKVLIWQTLVPTEDGQGRVALREYLILTEEVKDKLYQSNINNFSIVLKKLLNSHGRPLLADINDCLNNSIINKNYIKKYNINFDYEKNKVAV
ncbi:ATPase, T2SS/T4P/T4SS family [Piscirickettsia salmonis]|uniref:ATPase, T2SS/T4P/T4SS family n=1 Tax=Piscirickettsia salmonis TaxID=1238 RepID=UPI0007C8E212|nr:Twitching mobility protein [Piscirickettsiaceae bacterium NZ-RLO1]